MPGANVYPTVSIVSGEASLALESTPDSVISRCVTVLSNFPAEPGWVLVGGVAVFLRLGSVTRPTGDADTVAASQSLLVERLSEDDTVTVIAAGKLVIPTSHGDAKIDIMDLGQIESAPDEERAMFARARNIALVSAESCRVRINGASLDVTIPVATLPALAALKTVSMVRRPHGDSKTKVGSDIHDLVRLVATGARPIAEGIVELDVALAAWIADRVRHHFGDDLRMTLARLRAMDRSAGAQSLSDDAVGATVVLADILSDLL